MASFHVDGVRSALSRCAAAVVEAVVTAIREIRAHLVALVEEAEDPVIIKQGLAVVVAMVAVALLLAPGDARRDELVGSLLGWAVLLWIAATKKPDDGDDFADIVV